MITLCILEDHASLSDGLKLYLEKDGTMEVLSCMQSGEEMLTFMETRKPVVLITDISMPAMDGYEVCRQVKANFPDVKVIALSMFDSEQAIQEMMACGANGYVLKSSPLTILKTAILRVMESDTYYDPNIVQTSRRLSINQETRVSLSRSERDILLMISQGKSNDEMSKLRGTALSTIQKHRKNIMHKLGVKGKGELYKYALNLHGHSS
ncbi:MAG: response regulator transcription factor [Nonlabens sp.]|nr:response regulator transcription factor [Nonlabens sp.]